MDLSRNFLVHLNDVYRLRRKKNAAYSLRSFSRDLKLNPGRLSQYFAGARSITPKAALKMMNHLGLSPLEQVQWMNLTGRSKNSNEPKLLEQKDFELITEPIHFTILSLLKTKNFKNNTKWIARRIKSTVFDVTQSLKLLKELGLVVESQGKLSLSHQTGVRSSDGVKSVALKTAHQKQLAQSSEIIDQISIELRDITSITMAANPKKLEKAKALIKDFRRNLAVLLESGDATEVYRLQIQLIPLTNVEVKLEKENEDVK